MTDAAQLASPGAYADAVAAAVQAAAAYYADGSTPLGDDEYDALVRGIEAYEAAHPDEVLPDSPTGKVAGGAATGDVPHSVAMLSLDNVFSAEELEAWAVGLERRLGHPVDGWCVEPKLDSLAVAARYRAGRLVQVLTRGDGLAGEDITHCADTVLGLPARLTELLGVLDELDIGLAGDIKRGPGARRQFEPLVERLRTPAAAFLQPELERRLADYVEANDSFARDRIAHALAGACGEAALPALLRASVSDRNDDGDTLQLDLLELLSAWPETAHHLLLGCVASHDPGTRRVGIWGLSVTDFGGAKYFELVADAASDPDPGVRADVMSTLGSIFGVGDPPRARALLMAGARDPAPKVRRDAVQALGSAHDQTVTDLLVARTEDTDHWVRFWAAWSLARRPGPSVRTALERLAADEERDVREAARTVPELPTTA